MKYKYYIHATILIFLLSFSFFGCESNVTKTIVVEKLNYDKKVSENINLVVCNILSEKYLLSVFPEAKNFKPFSKEKPYPSCSYRFDFEGKAHKVGLTLVKKYASEKNLDKAVSYFKEKESLNEVGKKAYYIPKQGQVSLFNNNYLLHVYVTINEKGNKNLAIQITKELIEKIDN